MPQFPFPTFWRWLTTFEIAPRNQWRIAPVWKVDTWAAQQRTLLRTLALAARERLPYGPLVAALANDHQWFYRWRLGRLAQRLDAGAPLADAVEQTPGVLSQEQTLAVRFGVESGTLPAVLAALVHENKDAKGAGDHLRQMGYYTAALLVIAVPILLFMFALIVPQFRQIMDEFGLYMPPISEAVFGFGDWVSQYWWLLFFAALAAAWLAFSESGWRYFYRVWLPRVSRSAMKLRGAEVMHLLAIAQNAGRPIAGSLSTLARYYYDARVRGRLLFVRNEIEQGANPWLAMQQAGLFTKEEAHALEASANVSAQTWTLERLTRLRRQRAADRLRLNAALLHPLLMLLLAAGVLLIAVSMLGPFVYMINALA